MDFIKSNPWVALSALGAGALVYNSIAKSPTVKESTNSPPTKYVNGAKPCKTEHDDQLKAPMKSGPSKTLDSHRPPSTEQKENPYPQNMNKSPQTRYKNSKWNDVVKWDDVEILEGNDNYGKRMRIKKNGIVIRYNKNFWQEKNMVGQFKTIIIVEDIKSGAFLRYFDDDRVFCLEAAEVAAYAHDTLYPNGNYPLMERLNAIFDLHFKNPSVLITMTLDKLAGFFEQFGLDKQLVTLVPDPMFAENQQRNSKLPLIINFKIPGLYSSPVCSASAAIEKVYHDIISRVNWDDEPEELMPLIRAVKEKMREMISMSRVDHPDVSYIPWSVVDSAVRILSNNPTFKSRIEISEFPMLVYDGSSWEVSSKKPRMIFYCPHLIAEWIEEVSGDKMLANSICEKVQRLKARMTCLNLRGLDDNFGPEAEPYQEKRSRLSEPFMELKNETKMMVTENKTLTETTDKLEKEKEQLELDQQKPCQKCYRTHQHCEEAKANLKSSENKVKKLENKLEISEKLINEYKEKEATIREKFEHAKRMIKEHRKNGCIGQEKENELKERFEAMEKKLKNEEEMQKKMVEMANECKDMHDRLEKANECIQSNQQKPCQKCNAMKKEMTRNNENNKETIEELRREKEQLRLDLQKPCQKCYRTHQHCEGAKANLKSSENKVKKLEGKLETAEKVIKEYKEKEASIREKVENEWKERFEAMEKKLKDEKEMKSKMATITKENKAIKDSNEELKREKEQLKQAKDQLQAILEQKEQEIMELREQRQKTMSDARFKDKRIEDLTKTYSRLIEENQKLKKTSNSEGPSTSQSQPTDHLKKLFINMVETKNRHIQEQKGLQATEKVQKLKTLSNDAIVKSQADLELKRYNLEYQKFMDSLTKNISNLQGVMEFVELPDAPELSNEFMTAYDEAIARELLKELGPDEISDPECLICTENMNGSEKTLKCSKCRRRYHVPCVGKWLTEHTGCPVCKENMRDLKKYPELAPYRS